MIVPDQSFPVHCTLVGSAIGGVRKQQQRTAKNEGSRGHGMVIQQVSGKTKQI
jgi:hypothetical protein